VYAYTEVDAVGNKFCRVSVLTGRSGELHRAEGGQRNGRVVLVSHSVYRSRQRSLPVVGLTATLRAFHTRPLLPRVVGRRSQETFPVLVQTALLHEPQEKPATEKQVASCSSLSQLKLNRLFCMAALNAGLKHTGP